MDIEDAKQIVEFLEEEGDEAELREEYSGRGMFGKTTTGIVIDTIGFVYYAMGRLQLEFAHLRTDNMGLRMIVY